MHDTNSGVECVQTGCHYGGDWSNRTADYGACMEKDGKQEPIKLSGKTIGATLLGIVGALLLGVGMCLTMVWSHIIAGIVIGIAGIVVLLCLIPFIKGLK